MSLEVVSLGEILVEIMRKDLDVPHNIPGTYVGPYPSGAPAIFIDAAANLGLKSGFIGVVGDDEFGDLLLNRLRKSEVDTQHVRIAKGYTTGIAFCHVLFVWRKKVHFSLTLFSCWATHIR